jgi:hypothetical protein
MSVFTDFADLDGYELVHLFHEEEEDDFLNLSYSEDLNQLPLLLIDEDALGKKKEGHEYVVCAYIDSVYARIF